MAKKIKYVCLSLLIVLFLLCIGLALSLDIKKVYAEAQPLESGTHTCNGMEFEKFNDYSSQNYNLYLSEDFNNENAIGYSGLNINICLNGKSLHYTGGMNFSQCTVNFYDCSTLETGKVKNQIRVMADTTLTINGGTFKEVSAGEMAIYPGGAKADIVINEGVVEELNDKPYPNADCIFNGSITINGGVVKNIKVQNGRSVLSINGGTVGENNTSIIACKELHITGGMIGLFLVALSDYTAATPIERGKMYISGSPNFIYPEVGMGLVGFAGNDINGNFSVVGFPYIVLNNGVNGAEYREYTGNPIGIALMIASGGAKANLVGQTMAEGVTDSNADKLYLFDDINMQVDATYMLKREGDILKFDKIPIELFGENTKFYRNNLWDTFRSPAYPSSDRPFYLYDLSAPFDAKMNRIDFSGDKYVKFELNKTYTTVADLPTADKNRIVNSLKYSTYSNEQAILKALIVSEILYNGDGTVNRKLANVGLIWSLGEQGFLYTSLDSNGAFPYSGGIGTYVTFKAHNDGESIVDTTPKDDPLSKDDFDPDGDGNGSVEIPALPETTPPVNNDVYLNYLGKVIDNNGNPLVGVNVAFSYSGTTFNVVTEGSGYFTVPDFLVTAGQEAATVYLLYHDGTTGYGIKTYLNMPIATDGAVTYIYPLTQATDDGEVQKKSHMLTKVDYVAATCQKEGNQTYYICEDTTCLCGKLYGDKDGLNVISIGDIRIAKLAHSGSTATCTELAVCENCNQTYGELAAHTSESIAEVAATCTQTGLTAGSKCSVCDTIITAQNEIPALGHTEETLSGVAATCTQTGLTAGSKCSVCDTIITVQEIIQKLEHSYDDGEITRPPTLSMEGEKSYTCSVCGQTKTESLPRLTTVVNDEPIDLLWLIIVLAIVNVLELIAIGILLKRNHSDRKRPKNKNEKAKSKKLNSFICSPLLLLSSVFKLSQLTASIILGITAIAFGIIIVLLALKNCKQKQLEKEGQTEETQERLIGVDDNCSGAVQDLKQTVVLALSGGNTKLEVNKKIIADYLKEKYGREVKINRRANYTKTRLPLADTHYATNTILNGAVANSKQDKKSKSSCFCYVYELDGCKVFFLLKISGDYANQLKAIHPLVALSKFPRYGAWYSIIVDDSFTDISEVYEMLDKAKEYSER